MTEKPEDLSPPARQTVEQIDAAVRSAIADLERDDALDALDVAREGIVRLANELYAQRRT